MAVEPDKVPLLYFRAFDESDVLEQLVGDVFRRVDADHDLFFRHGFVSWVVCACRITTDAACRYSVASCQLRPSRSISAIAADGPQVPAV